ncbi:MAG: M48 family metalloprotease [Gaiellaceae bacterium]
MERRLGRDFALSLRMGAALVLLGFFYLPFLIWIALIGYFATASATLGIAAAALALATLPFTPALSERLVLAGVGARLIDEEEPSALRRRVERLCALGDLPVPRLAIAESDVPNAFSAGRTRHDCVVVVTTGLLDRLDDRELDAVLAHELAHIANRDAFVMTFVATPALLARKAVLGLAALPFRAENPGTRILGAFLVLYLLPLLFVGWLVCAIATLLVMTVSRYREYAADRGAALLTGEPEAVMSALQGVGEAQPLIPARDLRSASAFLFLPAAAQTDWFEVDPLYIFPTHPPIRRRIARLSALARTMARPLGLETDSTPVDEQPRPENPHAVASFSLALLVYSLLGISAILAQSGGSDFPVWLPLAASFGVIAGVVLGFQGVGRASAGARGMGYAVTALAMLLAPWALLAVGMVGAIVYVLVTA